MREIVISDKTLFSVSVVSVIAMFAFNCGLLWNKMDHLSESIVATNKKVERLEEKFDLFLLRKEMHAMLEYPEREVSNEQEHH